MFSPPRPTQNHRILHEHPDNFIIIITTNAALVSIGATLCLTSLFPPERTKVLLQFSQCFLRLSHQCRTVFLFTATKSTNLTTQTFTSTSTITRTTTMSTATTFHTTSTTPRPQSPPLLSVFPATEKGSSDLAKITMELKNSFVVQNRDLESHHYIAS